MFLPAFDPVAGGDQLHRRQHRTAPDSGDEHHLGPYQPGEPGPEGPAAEGGEGVAKAGGDDVDDDDDDDVPGHVDIAVSMVTAACSQ